MTILSQKIHNWYLITHVYNIKMKLSTIKYLCTKQDAPTL